MAVIHENDVAHSLNGIHITKPNSYAPWCTIPDTQIVSVEHPYIVRNIDKGLDYLGGPRGIKEVCHSFNETHFLLIID